MASANASVEESFFLQIERVRVGPRERVSRAYQVLQERERDNTTVRTAGARGYLQARFYK